MRTTINGLAITLAPAQQKVADDLLTGMTAGNVCVFRAGAGMGKTSVLRWLQAKLGGSIVAAGQFMALLKERSAAAIEETFMEVLEGALERSDVALVDDLHLVMELQSPITTRRRARERQRRACLPGNYRHGLDNAATGPASFRTRGVMAQHSPA